VVEVGAMLVGDRRELMNCHASLLALHLALHR
jgi:hypothetical protein